MKSIELDTTFGRIGISWPSSANGAVYISIDHYREGQMVYRQGRWNGYMNKKTILTGDDLTVLAELIENANKE